MSTVFLAILMKLGYFTFLYPISMSVIWVIGGFYFWWRRERKNNTRPQLLSYPPVTILVPCHNEAVSITNTCKSLQQLRYPNYRVVFIDDASSDDTGEILRSWVKRVPNFHLLRLPMNLGKARALNCAIDQAVNTSLTMVIDADTQVTPEALHWLVTPFITQPRLGAVSGNPLVSNRTSMLENLQAAEFASILGLIKRSQRCLGRMLTVSGCFTVFRTDVLKKVGGFSNLSATEDIDITWAIQRQFYEVWFEPRAIAFIQAPSNMKDFWRQRYRWSLGGWHLLRSHYNVFSRWRWRRMWPIYIDFVLSYLWSFCFVIGTILWLITYTLYQQTSGLTPFPAWFGAVLGFSCMLQFTTALLTNHQYDPRLYRSFFWVPWYPLFFFCFGALTVVGSACQGLLGPLTTAGQWKSPKRNSVPSLKA